MSLTLYKPNSKNAGAAFTFSIGSDKKNDEPTLFISAIAQYSWNAEKKIGSFSGNASDSDKTINVKLNTNECGEILSAIKNRYEYSTFHSYEENSTTIKFSPWNKSVKVSKYDPESKGFKEEKIEVPAFGVSISKSKGHTFKIPLDAGETEVLSEYLRFLLHKLFDVRTSRQREAFLSRQDSPKSAPKKEQKPKEVEPPAEDDDDEDVPF
jgi:hypothetical protein